MLSQSLLFENYFNLAPPLAWQEGNYQLRRYVPQAFLILAYFQEVHRPMS